jgi:fructokinase
MGTGTRRFYGAVEAGGTKFVCAIGDDTGGLLVEDRFATTDPAQTIATMLATLHRLAAGFGPLSALGLGSFGPVELRREAPCYGFILDTPKPGWSGTDIAGALAREFRVPIGFDTDVNGAALAEHRWGSSRNVEDLVYLTIGTGIGGGAITGGHLVHGLLHPEIGHLYPRKHPLDAHFPGVCPFHGDCLEGLAAGPAIIARCGSSLEQLPPEHPQWEIEADYLGQLCASLVLTLSPRRIVLGGGVMNQTRLLPMIRPRLQHWLGGYLRRDELLGDIESYVVPPRLGARVGILGALALALQAE